MIQTIKALDISLLRYPFIIIYLTVLSVFTFTTESPSIAFFAVILPLFLFRITAFSIIVYYILCILLFFDPYFVSSNWSFLLVPDSVLFLFLFLIIVFRRDPFLFKIPKSKLLLSLYAFLLYGLILSIKPLLEDTIHPELIRDVKALLHLGLIIVFLKTDIFQPKKLFFILFTIVTSSAIYGIVRIIGYYFDGQRVITYNEMFLSNSIVIAMLLLQTIQKRIIRIILYVSIICCLLGIIAVQTRSIWGSTLVSIALFALLYLKRNLKQKPGSVFKTIMALSFFGIASLLVLDWGLQIDVVGLISNRLGQYSDNELINPFSSMGYRVYESFMVWREMTFFGHGSGATIYLFFPHFQPPRWLHWWSIHSEYFEILHKYGIMGLGIFLIFLTAFLVKSFKLMMSTKSFGSLMGAISFLSLLNHMIVSITSGHIVRECDAYFIMLILGITEVYSRSHPQKSSNK